MAKSGKNKGYSYRYNKSATITCRAYFDMPNGAREQISATGKTEQEARKKLEENMLISVKKGKKLNQKVIQYKVGQCGGLTM